MKVFISFEHANEHEAARLSSGLEAAGFSTWYYTRDSRPGPSYLRQIIAAISDCDVVAVIVSRRSVASVQVTSEIVEAFEQRKPFVPVLFDITHSEFQSLQPEWKTAFRAATSIRMPSEGIASILPAIVEGLNELRATKTAATFRGTDEASPRAAQAAGAAHRAASPSWPLPLPSFPAPSLAPQSSGNPMIVDLRAEFDSASYPPGDDALAYWLAELRIVPEGLSTRSGEAARVGADIALVLDVSGSMERPNRYPLLRKAVQRFVQGLDETDRVSVTLFTDRSHTVVPFLDGAEAAENPDRILEAMDESGMLFGPKTLLAPALQMALDGFVGSERRSPRARRVYVLTDGELHDTEHCEEVLTRFRSHSVEVHAYGFGDEFDAAALKRLISDQIGGTVKPILDEENIVQVFAHIAAVNRALIGQNGKLTITLSSEVVCGDAWVYEPHGRFLGRIRDRVVSHDFGGIESGRRYSLLLEVRLSATKEPLAVVEAEWFAGAEGRRVVHRLEVSAPRAPGQSQPVAHVRRALDVVQVLRAGNDRTAQLASYQARRELAILERRDPELIAALDKMIAALAGTVPAEPGGITETRPWQKFDPHLALSIREQQILLADAGTSEPISLGPADNDPPKRRRLEGLLIAEFNDLLELGAPIAELLDRAIALLLEFVGADYKVDAASIMLHMFAQHLGASPAQTQAAHHRFMLGCMKGGRDVP